MTPYQSCRTCQNWSMCRDESLMLGVCAHFGDYRHESAGKECEAYLPLEDGEEVIRRGQAVMRAKLEA